MSASLVDPVPAFILTMGTAISGWVAFLYQYFSDRPKIKGKILQVMRGKMKNPKNLSENLTVFTLFLYLTNVRKNAIHLRDYSLEVDEGDGFERMKIVRGALSSFRFGYGEGELQIPNFEQGVIYKQSKPVEYGVPFYGYLVFAGDVKYYKAEIKRYRITCVDVFDHKHKITAKPNKFVDLFYLQEVFKIKFPTAQAINANITKSNQTSSNLINGNDVNANSE